MNWSQRTAKEIERGTSEGFISEQTERQERRIEKMSNQELAYRLVQAGAIAAWLDTWTAMLVKEAEKDGRGEEVGELMHQAAHLAGTCTHG